jgi:hypothetical protein
MCLIYRGLFEGWDDPLGGRSVAAAERVSCLAPGSTPASQSVRSIASLAAPTTCMGSTHWLR